MCDVGRKKKPRKSRNSAKIDRRRAERKARALVQAGEQLARLEPGGSPERPLEVVSTAVVEDRARRLGCVPCGGELSISDHAVDRHDEELLRKVSARCQRCHHVRVVWFRITPPLPN